MALILGDNDAFSAVTGLISEDIWFVALAALIAIAIYFNIRGKVVQITRIKETLHLFKENIKEKVDSRDTKSISAFRSFCTTMGSRVGIGNVAGVAMAIVMGGPGSIFWMWIFVLLLTAISLVENTLGQIYKEKMKKYHDKKLIKKEFQPGQLVLLFNSRLKLFPGKLRSKWFGPFRVKEVKPYGVVELEDLPSGRTWLANGQRLKHYLGGDVEKLKVVIMLQDP